MPRYYFASAEELHAVRVVERAIDMHEKVLASSEAMGAAIDASYATLERRMWGPEGEPPLVGGADGERIRSKVRT